MVWEYFNGIFILAACKQFGRNTLAFQSGTVQHMPKGAWACEINRLDSFGKIEVASGLGFNTCMRKNMHFRHRIR